MDHRSHEEGCMPWRTMALEGADGLLSPDPGQNHPAGGSPDSKGFTASGVLTWTTRSCVSRQGGSESYNIGLQRSFSLVPVSHDFLAGIAGGDAGIVRSDDCYWILCVCYTPLAPRDLTPKGEARVACLGVKFDECQSLKQRQRKGERRIEKREAFRRSALVLSCFYWME